MLWHFQHQALSVLAYSSGREFAYQVATSSRNFEIFRVWCLAKGKKIPSDTGNASIIASIFEKNDFCWFGVSITNSERGYNFPGR